MFKGSMVAIVTPMKSGVTHDTALDIDALERLVEFHIENGTDAIVAVGTTGESATLSEEEHCMVIRRVVEFAAGRVPVIAGTGANSTTEAIRLTECAKRAGADACLLVTPYYNKPTQEGLYLHHKAVAEAVAIPQILYNVPGRTACDLLPETAGRLSAVGNIIGIKEATGALERVPRLRELCGNNFALLSGDDATAMDFMLAGGDGVISVTANVAPRAMHDLSARALARDRTGAETINRPLEKLHKNLFVESNPIPVKWALYKMGLIEDGIRLPLTWLASDAQSKVLEALREAGVLARALEQQC
jgi:4-hydroxy-tetrahydrodipicolinate synthase